MTSKEKAAAMKSALEQAGVNIRRLMVIGAYVHIDTFNKYENAIRSALSPAGFMLVFAEDGKHMDEFHGFRMVFKLA